MDWISIDKGLPENGRIVLTRIGEGDDERNVQTLKREGHLWWAPDGSMYVYYRPTHWRELTDSERAKERLHLGGKIANKRDEISKLEALRASL